MTVDNSLSFWAQSLDNKSSDIIEKAGKKLDSSTDEAMEVCDSVNRVVSQKTELFSGSNIKIYCRKLAFVIEVIPDQRDEGQRRSPILIYGHLSTDWFKPNRLVDYEDLISKMQDFLNKIERTISPETEKELNEGLKKAYHKKKDQIDLNDFGLRLLIGLIIPISLGWLLQKQVPLLLLPQVTPGTPQAVQPPVTPTIPSTIKPSVTPTTPQAVQPPVTPTIPQVIQPQVTPAILQQALQRLIMLIAGFIAINNALMLILSKLSLRTLLN